MPTLVLLGAAALAPAAGARQIEPREWSAPDGGARVHGKLLELAGPSTVALPQTTRSPRRIEFRVEGGRCRTPGRVTLGGETVKRFTATGRSRRVRAKLRGDGAPQRLRVSVGAGRGCRDRVSIRRVQLREWVPIGSTAVAANLGQDPAYADLLARHLDSLTIGTDLQYLVVEPQRGRFNFTRADKVADFAAEHGMALRGHPLVWWAGMPRWIRDASWTRAQMIEVMRTHITALVSRYRGRISEWDVVNEPFEADGSYRHSVWYDAIGPDYVELALRFAHEADPGALLYVNEVDAEVRNARSDALYSLVASLRARGAPIDGVGFQSHVFSAPGPTSEAIGANFQRFAALGLALEVTEMDVPDDTIVAADAAARLAAQASEYRSFAAACRREPACARFTMWGLSDRYSWLGSERHPLPFDPAYAPKPAWGAIEQQLRPRAGPASSAAPE